ncbi:MAG: hypothetical protein GX237_09870 [Clostridiales bacterium]|nr:hypothetical protein [Clostridiales bacterium]
MSRRLTEDFGKLSSFLCSYDLSAYTACQQQINECKSMHKKLYGLMIFSAEYNCQNKYTFFSKFIEEMSSDLLLSLFNWIQGMYKPAKLELRCAIENFLKAVLFLSDAEIIQEKSVYEIFDVAKADKHFQTEFGKKRIELLRNDYSTLCRTVHSDPLQIHSTSALNLLPQYNMDLSTEFVNLYIRIVENSLGILYINYPVIVDNMHPENKKDFLDSLSKTTKKEIVGILYG